MELLYRFLIGGTVVSAFALIGDLVRPKSFAGLFGAAPSIALATLALTIHSDGPSYAATEARSMLIGALALLLYAWCCARVLWRAKAPASLVTLAGLTLWLGIACAGWLIVLRGRS